MFQNIESVAKNETGFSKEKIRKINVFANVFELRNIAIYIISFMISLIGLGGELSPFSISIFAACFANGIPLLGVTIVSTIGSAIKFGVSGALLYLLTCLVMVATFFVLRPRYNEEERNEKVKVSKNVFIATILVQVAKTMMVGFTVYDILVGITFSIVALVFYKIFVNSLVVLQDFKEKRAFSIEEVIGTSLLIAIAVSCFGELSIFGFGIRNVLSILIVMILGWKNGILVGTTSGVTIGVTIGIIASTEPIMIAAYAISGMIAGILNRFGRIGVIVGFALGNILLAYVSNGYTVELIHFKEILIASIGLLAIPKSVHIDIEEFMGDGSKLLPIFPTRTLNRSKETAERLNNVSETIQQMANTYKFEKNNSNIKKGESKKDKEIFIAELLDCLEPYKDNMLYEDMSNTEGKIVDDIFNLLMDKQEINKEDLLNVFAKNNSYIVGIDDNNISKTLENSIMQIVRAVNMAFKISKTNFVWLKKMEENQKNYEAQLNGVSKAISGIAKNIEDDIKKEVEFADEKKQIIDMLKLKSISVQEIAIKKQGRYLVEIYLDKEQLDVNNQIIEKIVSDVLKEKIVVNQDACIGSRINLISDDKYIMAVGTAMTEKSGNDVSGDSFIQTRLNDGKYLVAISDGMGSGNKAKQRSQEALKMLKNLLSSGFDKGASLELINTSLINQNIDEEIFTTLDIAIIDLYAGTVEMIKSGACPTYFKNNKKVQVIKSKSLPTGIINNMNLEVFDKDVENKEIMLMCTDGILDSNIEYKNKELWIKYVLEDIETDNTKKIADLLLNEAIDNNFGVPKDDMSIFVCKFRAKE